MRYAHLGVVVLIAAACGSSSSRSADNPDGGSGGSDGSTDGSSCTSFTTLLPFDTCKLEFVDDLTLDGALLYDTDTHSLTGTASNIPVIHTAVVRGAATGVLVLVEAVLVRNITLRADAQLRAIGRQPLVIIAAESVRLESGAQIDVSDGGANSRQCIANSASTGMSSSCGGAGGGGGGFAGKGGRGGDGCIAGTPSVGGSGGFALSIPPIDLRGGCSGAAGGNANGGAGGAGGGAVYLVAGNRIELADGAAINAGGGAGRAGVRAASGGGGGGSGGMLLLEAPHIVPLPGAPASGAFVANGGGGGGGADATTDGNDGEPGSRTTARAKGGDGVVAGGQGGSKNEPTGEDVTNPSSAGGAGGGGGVGIIRIKTADLQIGMISPSPQ